MDDKILVTEYCNIKTTIIKIIVCGCGTLIENYLEWRNDIFHLKFQFYSWECKNKYKSKSIPYLLKSYHDNYSKISLQNFCFKRNQALGTS